MRKFILSLMFIVLASTLSMASTNETKVVLPEAVETTTTSDLSADDGWWMCIELSKSISTDPFSHTTTTTTTYICYWMEF